MEKPKDVDTRVRIPPDLYERIKALAQRQHRSINSAMVSLLDDAVRRAERREREEAEMGNSAPVLLAA